VSDADKREIARMVAAELMNGTCRLSGTCQTFDPETIQAIKNAAQGYARLSAMGRWAGVAIASVIVATLAAGFCTAVWRGFVSMIKP
jgi:hypothetical protein